MLSSARSACSPVPQCFGGIQVGGAGGRGKRRQERDEDDDGEDDGELEPWHGELDVDVADLFACVSDDVVGHDEPERGTGDDGGPGHKRGLGEEGIAVAFGLSLIVFAREAWRPYCAQLGRIAGVRGYHDLARHPETERTPGVLIVRFDAPLFFANAGWFSHFIRNAVQRAPDVHTVILAAEPITDIDTAALEELVELDDHLRARRVTLLIAALKGPSWTSCTATASARASAPSACGRRSAQPSIS